MTMLNLQYALQPAFARAVDALPMRHRQVILLNELHRLPAKAIGEAMSLTAAEARIRLLDARRALRLSLLDDLHGQPSHAAYRATA